MKEKKYKVNVVGILLVGLYVIFFSILAISSNGNLVCSINNLRYGCTYGKFWIHCAFFFLFYAIASEVSFAKEVKK